MDSNPFKKDLLDPINPYLKKEPFCVDSFLVFESHSMIISWGYFYFPICGCIIEYM